MSKDDLHIEDDHDKGERRVGRATGLTASINGMEFDLIEGQKGAIPAPPQTPRLRGIEPADPE